MINTPGPCEWNGNEIVRVAEPDRGVAGVAPDAPDEWGPLFAAAPEMYEALVEVEELLESLLDGAYLPEDRKIEVGVVLRESVNKALAKARGQRT